MWQRSRSRRSGPAPWPSTVTASRWATRSSGWTAGEPRRSPRVPVAASASRATTPRKLRRWIALTGGAPAMSGKDPLAHILWMRAQPPGAVGPHLKFLEPKDYLNLKLTGECVATYDSIVVHWVTDNRDPSHVSYDARSCWTWSASAGRSCRTWCPPPSVIGFLTRGRRRGARGAARASR